MARKRVLDIRWPMAGLKRRFAYRAQPPFSTVDALNVRPDGVIKGRERGGSRPGLTKAYYEQLGSGTPVRLLNQCTVVRDNGQVFEADSFQGSTLSSVWTAAAWMAAAPGVSSDLASVSSTVGETGVTRDALPLLDTTQDYMVEMYIVPFEADHHGKYQLFLRMGAGLDATADGVIVELVLESATGALSGTVKSYSGSVLDDTFNFTDPGTDSTAEPGWFTATVSGNDITVKWRGQTVLATSTLTEGAAGSRIGFGINCTQSGGTCLVDMFRAQYYETGNRQDRKTYLVASSNGSVYRDTSLGVLAAISSSLTLGSDRQLQSTERGQKLYVADVGEFAAKDTDGATDGAGTAFTSATVGDFAAAGVNADDFVVVITSGTGVTAGTYEISSVATSTITLASSAGASATSIIFYIKRCPKIVDPSAATITRLVATSGKGQVPTGCPLVTLFRDRLVFAGDPENPHVWYMSRQGDMQDYKYDDTDTQRAVAGTAEDAGRIGDHCVSLINHTDDYLIFGCLNSLWVLRGDPAYGGQLDNLSWDCGTVDAKSWCRGPSGETIVLGRDGLYMLPPGANAYPKSISRESLPRELVNFDRAMNTITLEYDLNDRGIHIFLTSKSSGKTVQHWWFDWETRGFWPVELPSDMEPTAVHRYQSEHSEESAVLVGGRDGYIRKFSAKAETDDGTTISSWIKIGPISLSSDAQFSAGYLSELVGVTAENGGDVDWELYVALTMEGAASASTAFASGSWNTAGLNYKARPRGKGGAFVLKLLNGESARAWAFERATGVILKGGRLRKL